MQPSVRKGLKGVTTIVMTTLLLITMTLIIMFAAYNTLFAQKIFANQYRNQQAFEAAQAGLEYAMEYLNANSSAIELTATGGVVNYAIAKTTLTNNSSFTANINNPTASNYTLFLVTATGSSDDGTATRTVQIYMGQEANYPVNSLLSAGAVTLTGGATLTNTTTNINIVSGGAVTINNGADTVTSSGVTSSQGHYGSDVQQNVTAYQGLTEAQLFADVFGTSEASEKATMNTYYNNTATSGNYGPLLSGVTNKSIWIDQPNGATVSIQNGYTVGSATAPVLLIVEGTGGVNIANGVTFYGYIYSSGTVSLAGGAKIYGGISTDGATNISNGVGAIAFTKYGNLTIGSAIYGKVPGSWKDF
jgi:Tfp pilus assembly protein PilX